MKSHRIGIERGCGCGVPAGIWGPLFRAEGLRLEEPRPPFYVSSPSPLIIGKSPRHIPADGTPHPVPLALPGLSATAGGARQIPLRQKPERTGFTGMSEKVKKEASNGLLFLMADGFPSGHRKISPVMEKMMKRLNTPDARFAYIGAANGDDRSFFRQMQSMLIAAGAGSVELVSVDSISSDSEVLRGANVVFMSGGDVEEGMKALRKQNAGKVLYNFFRDGKAFMGSSAGSIMLGRAWVRWRNPDDEDSAELFPCLGLAPFIVDCHDEESDWEELKTLMSISPQGSVGYGIPSGSGIMVESNGRVRRCGLAPKRFAAR